MYFAISAFASERIFSLRPRRNFLSFSVLSNSFVAEVTDGTAFTRVLVAGVTVAGLVFLI
jgi:hypothetical protein